MQNCQKLMLFKFDHLRQIFEKLFAKNMKGGTEKSEMLYVGQLARAKNAPFMAQI